MRKPNELSLFASLSLALMSYGCAAPIADEGETGSQVEAKTQALEKGKLLALGDSIAFGYSPFGDFTSAKNFQGYPEMLSTDYSVKNASCPGETSASLMSATAPDNGCRAYRAAYPLHVNYGESTTQLEYALHRLTDDDGATDDDAPSLITLNVSGNDIFLLQKSCAADPANYANCFSAGVPGLIRSVTTNVATIIGAIQNTGYAGKIVYMTVYSVDYTDPNTVGFLNALNGTVAQTAHAMGAKIADGYGAFKAAAGGVSPCAAGLLVTKPTGGCDVHPSAAGAQVLAQSVRVAQ